MGRLKEFLKSKGFYIALGTGIVAFAALMMVYNYSATKDELTREQAIDLNQPVIDDEGGNAQQENTKTADNDASNNASEPAGSDGVIKNGDKKTENDTDNSDNQENVNDEDDVKSTEQTVENEADDEDASPVTSDGAKAASGDDTDSLTAGLEYNGEQSLAWPLIGNVILPYSMDTTVYFQTLDSYRCNPGMLIEGEEGSNVMAAYEGVVTAVEDNKEFGTVVRIDMGNEYEAVYGQLMNVCVSVGDTVTMAENIAEVGPASSYYAEEGNHLYFAVTKDGVPVNPMSLIK